jgi:glutamate--cysteine ligase
MMSMRFPSAVPHLTTAQSGPLAHVEQHLLGHQSAIETWFRQQWRQSPPPFYTSVDLRNAGYKIAPVDTNLFPAGFNNLNPVFLSLCIQAMQAAVERVHPQASRIVIVPENHTRNLFYLESVAILRAIIEKAGFEVRIGSLLSELTAPQNIELPSGKTLTLDPLTRTGERAHVGDFSPDLIILNNDLSAGRPAPLENLSQPVAPPLVMGWSTRLKSRHFTHYSAAAQEFGRKIGLDPWLIEPLFKNCGEVNFMDGSGMNCLRRRTGELLTEIQQRYDHYGITTKPFIIVKADAGTYGMGVMTVHDPEEVMSLNRKQRTRMATTKEGQAVRNVIIQEGVYTHETWGEPPAVAEPVVYLIDRHVVGGFYRVHTGRSVTENLNTPGMRFEPLAFADCCISPDRRLAPDAQPNRFYAYGVVARLALVAAAREMAASDLNSE